MEVSELFEKEKLEESFIEAKFDGSYWEKAHRFVVENWNRELETMSAKQQAWVEKILEDCVEKRIEG